MSLWIRKVDAELYDGTVESMNRIQRMLQRLRAWIQDADANGWIARRIHPVDLQAERRGLGQHNARAIHRALVKIKKVRTDFGRTLETRTHSGSLERHENQ